MQASGQAGSRLAAFFSKGREMQAKADLAVLAEDLGAELLRPIPAAQARRDWRAAAREVRAAPAVRSLHFGVLAEGGPDQEGAARRRKA